jgi:uncharacterized protein
MGSRGASMGALSVSPVEIWLLACAGAVRGATMRAVEVGTVLNRAELRRYLARVGDRWPIEAAYVGGARVADERGAPAQRERGSEYVVVLVSQAFDHVPWLERAYVAGSLWDGLEMGAGADVHCYTPAEFSRKCVSMPLVREAVWQGIDLMAPA